MASYFCIDANGNKRGPYNEQQLQVLAAQGVITPATPLETDTGHKGIAGQIAGLNFSTAPPNMQIPSGTAPQQTTGLSIFGWLTDFMFRDFWLPVVNRWICRITYVLCLVGAILTILYWTVGSILVIIQNGGDTPIVTLLLPPLSWVGALLFAFYTRLLCELWIVLFDWIFETTQAAQHYNETNK
jgi:hypothetical protein